MNKGYKFYIQFDNREYRVEYRPDLDWMTLESLGPITSEEYYRLKRYLRTEGFLDKGTNYTII